MPTNTKQQLCIKPTGFLVTIPSTCSKENSLLFPFGLFSFPLSQALPKMANSCVVALSNTKSMLSVPICMGTLLLYSLSLTTTKRQGSLKSFTWDKPKIPSMYPLYLTLIPPVPSISSMFFKLFTFSPNNLATLSEIVEICDPESIRAFKVVPFNIISVSFASPIRRNKGSGL